MVSIKVQKTSYICDVCNKEYSTEYNAKTCEKQDITKEAFRITTMNNTEFENNWEINDLVIIIKTETDYDGSTEAIFNIGKIVEERIETHCKLPIIHNLNNDELDFDIKVDTIVVLNNERLKELMDWSTQISNTAVAKNI